jgi:multimeric flavodoxin WrbA
MKSDAELMKILEVDARTLNIFKKIREDTIKEAKRLSKGNKKIKVLGISGSARDEFDMAQESSNSEELLKRCLGHCKKLGAEIELIPLRKYDIRHCKACYSTTNTQCHFYCSCYPKGTPQGDDMSNMLYDKVLGADAVIFATPVNNFKMSTLMAAFIDRCISLDGSLKPANAKSPKDKKLNIKHMKFIELTADNTIPGSGMLKRFTGKVAGIIVTGHEEGASMVITNLFMALNHFGMIFPPYSNMYAMASVCNSTYEDKKIVLGECYEKEAELLAKNIITASNSVKKNNRFEWVYDNGAN